MRRSFVAWGALILSYLPVGVCDGESRDSQGQSFDLKAGQELTSLIVFGDQGPRLTAPRYSQFGSAQPGAGEITIGLSPRDKTLYERVVVVEKTSSPIDFLATGLVGATKIDEAVLCGRLDGPSSARIGAVSWRVSLNHFELRKDGDDCH